MTRAREALDHAHGVLGEWVAGNLARGGVCDFCAGDLAGSDVTWVAGREIRTAHVATLDGETAVEPLTYDRFWAACPDCDPVVSQRDPSALVEFVMPRRPGHVAREGIPEEDLAEIDARVESDLLDLYTAFFATNPVRVRSLREAGAKIPDAVDDGKPTGRWKDAYERQMDLWRFVKHPRGRSLLQAWARVETKKQPVKRDVFAKLLPVEEHKLLSSPPIYVSEEMVDLIDQARPSFKPEPFLRDDLLLPQAFVYFARPILISDRHGRTVNVQAICYAPVIAEEGEHAEHAKTLEGIALSFYSSLDVDEDDATAELRAARDYATAHLGAPYYDLQILHLVPLWFDVDPEGEEVDVDTGGETGFAEWWSLVQVTFRMMKEHVAEPRKHALDRHSRKRGARAGFDPRSVIVVKLRRAKHDRETESERDVEWSHRWLVDGHWRNQWYPSLGVHRQRWIGTYVKGPDDKPLVVKRKVYEWDR